MPSKSVYYNSVSDNYDFSRRAGPRSSRVLIDMLSPIDNLRVLDIGCGTGNFLAKLYQVSCKLVGLDISAGMLAKARAKVTDAVLVEGDASLMPFSSKSFDAAYCIQVFHHISDKTKFLQEVYRILRSNGQFVIQTCSHEQLATFVVYHYFPRGFEFERKRFPRIEEISALLTEVGFCNIEVCPCPFDGLSTESPEAYLDKRYRDGLSTFSYLSSEDIEQGCDRIRQDLASGKAIKVVETLRETIERISGQVTFIRSVKS